jgi:ribosomal protein S18 acetylase RimI-like enzyme
VPVGRVGLDFVRRAPDGIAYLWSAYVKPKQQSHGIGTALCVHLEEVAQERGFGAISLGVEKKNRRAQRLYLRLGYDVCGEEIIRWTYRDRGRTVEVVDDCWTMEKRVRPQPPA